MLMNLNAGWRAKQALRLSDENRSTPLLIGSEQPGVSWTLDCDTNEDRRENPRPLMEGWCGCSPTPQLHSRIRSHAFQFNPWINRRETPCTLPWLNEHDMLLRSRWITRVKENDRRMRKTLAYDVRVAIRKPSVRGLIWINKCALSPFVVSSSWRFEWMTDNVQTIQHKKRQATAARTAEVN